VQIAARKRDDHEQDFVRSGECAGGHFLARRAARKRNLFRDELRRGRAHWNRPRHRFDLGLWVMVGK